MPQVNRENLAERLPAIKASAARTMEQFPVSRWEYRQAAELQEVCAVVDTLMENNDALSAELKAARAELDELRRRERARMGLGDVGFDN